MDALILLLPIALLVLLVLRSRRQQRAASALQAGLLPGQRVMTTSGMYGAVVEVDDRTVLLEVADGVRVRFVRAAVARTVDEPAAPAPEGPDEGAATSSSTDPRER